MAQQVWNFKDQFGVDHSFGIYHGEESGHFISYLDNQIMHIDFMILAEKQYSFYINHELMRFSIQKLESTNLNMILPRILNLVLLLMNICPSLKMKVRNIFGGALLHYY